MLSKASYVAAKNPSTSSQQQIPAKKNIFGDSSSDDDGPPIRKVQTSGSNFSQLKLQQKLQQDALAEDPSIFQYDEVYEEIDNKRKQELNAKKTTEARKPKYINKLLEAAGKRKIENERRVERKVQKEREAEGEEFKDKEQFVTSSYRKKLEEMKKLDEEEAREARIEALTDVTKQKDLSGFYRHLFRQKMETEEPEKDAGLAAPSEDATKKKNYRKRKSSEDEEANDDDDKPDAHLPSNLDADSDFEIDSSDSESEKGKENAEVKVKVEPAEVKDEEKPTIVQETASVEIAKLEIKDEFKVPADPPKPKIDIWKKRTVGEAYDQAVQKYYERKALKESQRAWINYTNLIFHRFLFHPIFEFQFV